MNFYQEVLLIVISGVVGVIVGVLALTVKLGPRLTQIEQSMSTRLETGLSKSDLLDFENRFLERLNGRYLRTDLAVERAHTMGEKVEAATERIKKLEEKYRELHKT